MGLRVKPTPTRFPTNNLYTPMDNTPLHFISSVCHPLLVDHRYENVSSAPLIENVERN